MGNDTMIVLADAISTSFNLAAFGSMVVQKNTKDAAALVVRMEEEIHRANRRDPTYALSYIITAIHRLLMYL